MKKARKANSRVWREVRKGGNEVILFSKIKISLKVNRHHSNKNSKGGQASERFRTL